MTDALATTAFRDPSLPTSDRVEDLLGLMTLEEKIAQLGCVWSTALAQDDAFSADRAERLLRDGTGQITRIGAATGLRPRESAAFLNKIQLYLANHTRLGIPALVHEESTAGFTARDADQFPQAIGLASTWNPDRLREIAETIRKQMLAVGARLTLAPVLDIARDPRWGRVEETYGEDPYLAGRLGVAYVEGLQGPDLRRGVAATGKHFLGYGLSEGGHNHKPAHIGARELREVFARPFLAVIQEAGIRAIMNAYNEIDGLPCGGAGEILDDLLRSELGFEGVVVADYFTTGLLISSHRVAADKAASAKMALEAGLDAELPQTDCYAELVRLVQDGTVDIEHVDRSVRRVLALKFDLGLFERPLVDSSAADQHYQTPAARNLAREAARESLVLLKNEGGILPISPEAQKLAVIGPAADDPRLLEGDYHYPAHLEIAYAAGDDRMDQILPKSDETAFAPGPYFPPIVTPLAGLRAALPDATITCERGCAIDGDDDGGIAAAETAARAADVTVVFVGGRSGLVPDCTSGEFRDTSCLSLTGVQEELVRRVAATGTPTVVVVVGGRVFALTAVDQHAPAILQAWVPGEEGGHAIADVLTGAASPSGRLPVTMPRSVGQVPLYYNRRWHAETALGLFPADYTNEDATPLFPFGHGLSYSCFDYGDLRIETDAPSTDAELVLSFTLRNSGDRPAAEVAQIYVQDLVASVTRPIQQLVGFTRVNLEPNEQTRIRCTIHPSQLAFHDRRMTFGVEPGAVRISIGSSSANVPLSTEVELSGTHHPVDPKKIVATRVEVGE